MIRFVRFISQPLMRGLPGFHTQSFLLSGNQRNIELNIFGIVRDIRPQDLLDILFITIVVYH